MSNPSQAGWLGGAPARLGLLSTVGQSSPVKLPQSVDKRKEKKRNKAEII
jgi:hypothetical protein